jgi:cobalt transporter subunit CbtB
MVGRDIRPVALINHRRCKQVNTMKSDFPADLDLENPTSIHPLQSRLYASIVVGFLGLALVWITAFSPLPTIHNAAHDARHAFAAPCH